MNFYISSSNRFKILLSFFIFIFLSFIFSIYLNYFFHTQADSNFWIENKISKSNHLKKSNLKKLDYIFIGSSRTLYHISTDTFKKNGIDIYNFGLSHLGLYDYSFCVNRAIEASPKSIIISLSISDFFNKIPNAWEFTVEDLVAVSLTQEKDIIYESMISYLQGINNISKYSLPLRNKIIEYYNSSYISNKTNIKNIHKSDCIFFEKSSDKSLSARCTNGDAILFRKNTLKRGDKIIELDNVNKGVVNILNYLINTIKDNNIQPIIVLEPMHHNNYMYDLNAIKQLLDTKNIIDLTSYHIKNNLWADGQHLNNEGRLQYSTYLSKYLLTL